MQTLKVLSLGAGVQSTTLALMVEKGELPMVDAAIFADTGAEPQAVYDHLTWLKEQLSYPVHVVQWRNLKQDLLSDYRKFLNHFSMLYLEHLLDHYLYH